MFQVDEALLHWLGTLSEDMLTRVIAARTDARQLPRPRHIGALASRLSAPDNVTATIHTLPTPAIEVLRAIAVLPVPATRDNLVALLGVEENDPDLAEVMTLLMERALVWETNDGHLQQLSIVAEGWLYPLGLGRSVARLLQPLDFERVKALARVYGLPLKGSKNAIADRITACFTDRDRITQMIETGPAGVDVLLQPFVQGLPIGYAKGVRPYFKPQDEITPVRWAIEHGLLWYRDWDTAEMPREIALTLRGPEYHAPFTPIAPTVPTRQTDQVTIDQEAAIAAGHLLDRIGALLDLVAKAPLPTIKTGGVGQREIKRLAKVLSCHEDEIRVLLETAFEAGLIKCTEAGVQPTKTMRGWAKNHPAEQYATLAHAWWSSERVALPAGEGSRPAALSVTENAKVGCTVRQALLRMVSALPVGVAMSHTGNLADEIAAAVVWRCPIYPDELVKQYLPCALTEATLIGVVAQDAASTLGRVLIGDNDLAAVARDLLTVTCQTALLGPDLTAVVTGPPAAELARVLDRLANRESRGAASVWRFSPATIRRALDNGFTAQHILSDLATVASAGVPQPLDYLVKDVARRHGEVSVTDVVCVIRGIDESLLAEIAAHRKLAKLGLYVLAPTVLASGEPLAQTLTALREAGYAPVPAGPDGVSTIKRVTSSRSVSSPPSTSKKKTSSSQVEPEATDPRALAPRALDPRALAKSLRAAAVPESISERELYEAIMVHAKRLTGQDRFSLQYLIAYGMPARVEAELDDGTTAQWLLNSGELEGETLYAWCPAIQDYQCVRLSSITKVRC